MTGKTTRGANPPYFLPALYAVVPTFGALLWLIWALVTGQIYETYVSLLSIFQSFVMIWALLLGLSRTKFLKAPAMWERGALLIIVAILVYGFIGPAVDAEHGAIELVLRLFLVVVAISIAYLISRYDRRMVDAFIWAVIAAPLLHFPLLVVLYFGYFDHPNVNWLGGPVGFWHVRLWGMTLAGSLAMAIGFAPQLSQKGMQKQVLYWAAVTLLWAMLFWSGSRAGVLGVCGAYLISLALFWRVMSKTILPFIVTIVIGAGLSVLPGNPLPMYGMFNSLAETVGSATLDGATGGRLTMWRDALSLVAQHPLLGWGFDQYRFNTFGQFDEAIQPHNIIINLLLDVGIVGTICVVAVVFSYWLKGLLSILRDETASYKIGAFTALNALLAISLVDGALYHPDPSTLIAILFAILLATPRPVASPGQ